MRKTNSPSARKIYKVQMYGINRYRDGSAQIYACGDSRLRGRRSRKPIGFRQWVVHIIYTYKSSNKKVAAVNSEGRITAKKKGTAKITIAIVAYDGEDMPIRRLTVKVKVK